MAAPLDADFDGPRECQSASLRCATLA